jgi:hypothetical protein
MFVPEIVAEGLLRVACLGKQAVRLGTGWLCRMAAETAASDTSGICLPVLGPFLAIAPGVCIAAFYFLFTARTWPPRVLLVHSDHEMKARWDLAVKLGSG